MIQHPSAVIYRLENEIEKAGSQKAWAKAHGFSPQFVNDVLHGRRDITDALAKELDFERVTHWKDLRDKGQRGYILE